MKNRFVKVLMYVMVLLLLPYASIIAQDEQFTPQREIQQDSILIYARMIIDSSDSRVFITVDETGKPRARTMSVFTPEENWVIWLGTFPTSRKVEQIKNNGSITRLLML